MMANAGLAATLATATATFGTAIAVRFASEFLNEEARQWRRDQLSGAVGRCRFTLSNIR